jgi:hypothetical protein
MYSGHHQSTGTERPTALVGVRMYKIACSFHTSFHTFVVIRQGAVQQLRCYAMLQTIATVNIIRLNFTKCH